MRRIIWPLKIYNIAIGKVFNYSIDYISNNWKWCIILCHGGRFAICIFFGIKLIYHKTLRRYVVRKKQGKRQANYMKKLSSSGPGSAGGHKRIENEKKLLKEIQEILTKSEKYLSPPSWLMKNEINDTNDSEFKSNDINDFDINFNFNSEFDGLSLSNANASGSSYSDSIKMDRIFIHAPGDYNKMCLFGTTEEQDYLYPRNDDISKYGVDGKNNQLQYELCMNRLLEIRNKNKSSNLNLYRLWKNDKRIIKIPITTYKPTIEECMRIHYWLSTVWLKIDNENSLQNGGDIDDRNERERERETSGNSASENNNNNNDELFTIREEHEQEEDTNNGNDNGNDDAVSNSRMIDVD